MMVLETCVDSYSARMTQALHFYVSNALYIAMLSQFTIYAENGCRKLENTFFPGNFMTYTISSIKWESLCSNSTVASKHH